MILRHTLSTLFPYTTLFRSIWDYSSMRFNLMGQISIGYSILWFFLSLPIIFSYDYLNYWILDRKSTRLNSSHVSISYAVFCLKKKNKINIYYLHYNEVTLDI